MKIKATDGSVFELRAGSLRQVKGGYGKMYRMSRATVRKIFKTEEGDSYPYGIGRTTGYFANAFLVSSSIIGIGCITFLGQNFRRLRKWALTK